MQKMLTIFISTFPLNTEVLLEQILMFSFKLLAESFIDAIYFHLFGASCLIYL